MSYFVLSRVGPSYWDFGTDSLDTITVQLMEHMCNECCLEAEAETIACDPISLTDRHFLDSLLETVCGYEFILSEYQDIFEYAKDTALDLT